MSLMSEMMNKELMEIVEHLFVDISEPIQHSIWYVCTDFSDMPKNG